MALTATNVKLDPDKIHLAKLKGVNISQVCRDALDSYLRLSGGDGETLKNQLVEIEKQIQMLTLEKKLIMSQLETLEASDVIESYRESKYNQWKPNLAYQISHNTIDWRLQKELFKFTNMEQCKTWMVKKLKNEGLI